MILYYTVIIKLKITIYKPIFLNLLNQNEYFFLYTIGIGLKKVGPL